MKLLALFAYSFLISNLQRDLQMDRAEQLKAFVIQRMPRCHDQSPL